MEIDTIASHDALCCQYQQWIEIDRDCPGGLQMLMQVISKSAATGSEHKQISDVMIL